MILHVISDDPAWDAFAFHRGCSVEKTFVHISAMEDVMDITPSGFVIFQVEFTEDTARLPITPHKLLEDNRVHYRDVNSPLPEPLGTWKQRAHTVMNADHR